MIRSLIARVLVRLGWQSPPAPRAFGIASMGRARPPSQAELLQELRCTAWTCASLNASTCACFPPRLFVTTRPGQAAPRCVTRQLNASTRRFLDLSPQTRNGATIEEVSEHPLLTLLEQVNPWHNAFDLWELTTLYQEVFGVAYWLLEPGPFGAPQTIWPMPAHEVAPIREPDSSNLVDAYLVRTARGEERVPPERIIAFRYPDPASPYLSGLSPLRACYDQVRLSSELSAFKRARFENHALPDAIISPDQVIGEEERDRLELLWNNRLRRGGAGRVLVTESAMRVQLLQHSMGDLAALADLKATKEDIANAFHVPLAFLTSETNLANLQAAEQQHTTQAIRPRLRRRDEKLNEQLVPLFDPTGRLFLASDDPVPANREMVLREQELHLQQGVRTINEVRAELRLAPVPWGDVPRVLEHSPRD